MVSLRQRLVRLFLGFVLVLAWAPTPAAQAAPDRILVGPAGSEVFGEHVYALANGNVVVVDHLFDNGTVVDAGAVFLYNGATGALISRLPTLQLDVDPSTLTWRGNSVLRGLASLPVKC